MNLKNYLETIQNDESIFPMDSYHKDKKIFRVVYPESENLSEKDRIMIDFDKVIHSYDEGFKDGSIYGKVISGAKEAIDKLKDMGFEIVIFTTRASDFENDGKNQKEDVKKWLQKNNIYFDNITAEKLGAVAYIDDKAVRFENWKQVMKIIGDLMNSGM